MFPTVMFLVQRFDRTTKRWIDESYHLTRANAKATAMAYIGQNARTRVRQVDGIDTVGKGGIR